MVTHSGAAEASEEITAFGWIARSSHEGRLYFCRCNYGHARPADGGKVCEMTMQGLRDDFTVCEKAMQGLHDDFTVCETTVQDLQTAAKCVK